MNRPKILIPIHSQWCEKIFNGEKRIEVRKTAPKIDTPFEALAYCTKGKPYLYKNPNNGELFLDNNGGYRGWDYEDRYLTGKVIGSFVCDSTTRYNCDKDYDEYFVAGYIGAYMPFKEMCLTNKNLIEYGKGDALYGWHITEPKLFDKPRELSEFGTVCDKLDNDKCDNCPYLRDDDAVFTWCGVDNIKPITRAPQSWCYVEEIL